MKNKTHVMLAMLALPAAMSMACGEGTVEGELPTREAEHVTMTRLSIESEGPYVLHPAEVVVELDVDGPAFETDLIVGLETADGSEGCVLGAMKLEHAAEGDEHLVLDSEFVVNGGCWPLTERDDVHVFASFDPWNRLGDGSTDVLEQADVSRGDLLSVMQLSRLSAEACTSCDEEIAVAPSPGLDAQLREVSLSSSVAILPLPEPGAPAAQVSPTPDFSVSSRMRVTGLDKSQGLHDGEAWVSHRLRPAGETSPSAWRELVDRGRSGLDLEGGNPDDLRVSGPNEINRISALHLEGEVRDAMIGGDWRSVEDFELEVCVHTSFEQAIYDEESTPRANDCAVLPVVVVRIPTGLDGLPVAALGGTNARTAESWNDSWGWSNNTFGYSGLSFDAWLDVNASDGASETYGGIDVLSAGSWFEAGVESVGTVFGQPIDIIDLYATFIGYDNGGGGVAMGASIFLIDFIDPLEIQIGNGIPITLQDVFDIAGVDLDPSLSAEYVLAGVDFDDGCGGVEASMKAVGTIGIDTTETSVTVTAQDDGVEVSGTVTPYLDVAAVASTSVSYSEYLSGGVAVTLSLLNISVPFTVTAELIMDQGTNQLIFNELAQATLTVLSGDISYYINYKIPWPLCWVDCNKTHDGTLLDWDGYSPAPFNLFSATQTISWDDDPSVCGNNVCEWDEGSTCTVDCGPTWMYADRVDVDDTWTKVRLPYDFTNPVVIAGPPSYNGAQPTTVRVRNVTSDSFEIRLQEYLYLDGTHTTEQVAWMVVEEGTHLAPDGTQWEVGTTTAGGDPGNLSHTSFSDPSGSTPLLLASTMTFAGTDPMVLRAQNVDSTGFDLLVQEEDPTSAHINWETVGYVAISGTPSSWDGSECGYLMDSSTSNGVDENWWTFGAVELMVQEEQSQDAETDHALEQLHVLRMEHSGVGEQLVFAIDTTVNGTDTAGLRWR